jgi:PST family polysaccharide transporter
MNLIKTSFWTGLSTVIKTLAGIVTTKIMAVYIGPAGIALLGNFNNVTGMMTTFANGAISNGVTKYISEYETDDEKQNVTVHALKISLLCSIVIGLAVLAFHRQLAIFTFGDTRYAYAYTIFGFSILLFGLNALVSSVLNGYRYIQYLVASGIVGSIVSVVLAFFVTMRFGIAGALLNSAIAQVFIFLINLLFIRKLKLFQVRSWANPVNRELAWKLFKFALMSLTSTLLVPTTTLLIRKYIMTHFSVAEAGYVQGIWSISGAYLMVITTTLSVYFLPTLSGIKNDGDLRNEIFNGYRFILPGAILGGSLVYFLRDWIIQILYSPSFIPMRHYFAFQIMGDSLKIASWILAFLMIAKAMTRIFIITEIVFSLSYLGLAILMMRLYGSIGVTYAYSINYLLYLIMMVIIFRKLIFVKGKKQVNQSY